MARSGQKATTRKRDRSATVAAGQASASKNVGLEPGRARTSLVLDVAKKIHDGAALTRMDLQKLAKDICEYATDYQDYNCPPPPAKGWWRP